VYLFEILMCGHNGRLNWDHPWLDARDTSPLCARRGRASRTASDARPQVAQDSGEGQAGDGDTCRGHAAQPC